MTGLYYVANSATKEVRPSSMEEWSRALEHVHHADDAWRGWARVGDTEITGVRISTVFMGLDHNYGGGEPLIFETMVFGGALDGEQERYSTWTQAEAGHAAMVERVRARTA